MGESIFRGQISLRISLCIDKIAPLLPELSLLKELKEEWEKYAKALAIDPKSIDLPFLIQHLPQQGKDLAQDQHRIILIQEVERAIQDLLKMKQKEGKALIEDILLRLDLLIKCIEKIERFSPDSVKKMKQKLLEKIEEVSTVQDERILKEVALFAEKVDITEELTRFRSHIDQFHQLIQSKEILMGRKMDFLIQEMVREVNTIASKSMDIHISHQVIEMKSELEKIREQSQNSE